MNSHSRGYNQSLPIDDKIDFEEFNGVSCILCINSDDISAHWCSKVTVESSLATEIYHC